MNPELDLTLQRVIRAPRSVIWEAWTDPDKLKQWWIPAPMSVRIDRLEVQPGGGFVTAMSEDGIEFIPHVDAVFIVVENEHRLVFSNAISSEWRPSDPHPVAMTAEIILDDHAEGTDYRVIVRHGDPAARARHEEIGFFEGWGAVTDQLTALVEGEVAQGE